jgi:hypothetical protein
VGKFTSALTARRVICRWRQELAVDKPGFVEVEITDRPASSEEAAS